MCSQERRARVKGAEDQGEKRPNKKSSNNRDLGDCKETEVVCSRRDLVWEWGGWGWGGYPDVDPFLVYQQSRRNSSLGEKKLFK